MSEESKDQHLSLNELAAQAHQNSVDHGFWSMPRDPGEILMLIVKELGQAMEAIRDGQPLDELRFDDADGRPVGFPFELADALIRLLDACAALNVDIGEAVRVKMSYNVTRPYLHGRTR